RVGADRAEHYSTRPRIGEKPPRVVVRRSHLRRVALALYKANAEVVERAPAPPDDQKIAATRENRDGSSLQPLQGFPHARLESGSAIGRMALCDGSSSAAKC